MKNIILKNTIKSLYCILLIFASLQTMAQTDNDPSKFLPNIIPPSPEAFKFAMYGNTPIGLFAGTPNIQIPLFTYKTTNLKIPFSLTYSSSGIKVDDVNSKVGLGWNMIGGGVISRIIRNKEDNYEDDFALKHLNVASLDKSDALVNVYFNLFGEAYGKDSERDLFMFNFLNYSGKFYFDDNNNIVFLEKNDLKIDVINNPGDDIFTFSITANDGTKYFFQELEQTMLNTYGGGHPDPSVNYTAWYLNKIISIKGDEIYIEYNNFNEYYVQSESQQASRSFPYRQDCASSVSYEKGITFGTIYTHSTRIIGKSIKSIYSNNQIFGRVDFEYEDKIPNSSSEPDNVIKTISVKNQNLDVIEKIDFSYIVTPNKRIFLDNFHFLDNFNIYSFTYFQPNNFPVRLSRSQDHWGYFNGVNNSTLLPIEFEYGFQNFNYNYANKESNENYSKIGLLNKINYPTKGYTEFEYQSNDYFGEKKIMPPIYQNPPIILDNNDDEQNKEISTPIFAHFSYEVKLTGETHFSNCDPSQDTGLNHHKGIISVFCVEDNKNINIYQHSAYGIQVNGMINLVLDSNSNTPYFFNVEKGKNYIVKLKNNFNCIHSVLNLEYYNDTFQILNTNILTGGLRVKSTKDYSLNTTNPIIKKYYYSKFDQLNISSGNIGQNPYYVNFSYHSVASQVNALSCSVKDVVLNSSSVSSLFDTGSNNVYYKYVTVSEGEGFEKGYEENEFIINRDYWEHSYLGDVEFRNVPWSNLGWNNGKLLNTKLYEKKSTNYILKKETTNNYLKDLNNPIVVNYAIMNPALGQFTTNIQDQCGCVQSNINESYPVVYCTTAHFHKKNSNGYCIANNAANVNETIWHPCHNRNVGEIITIPTIIHMDIMPYKYISYFQYLSSTLSAVYDANGLNPITVTTNYNYNNPAHLQLTSQATINSTGETLETKYYYPADLITEPFMQDLVTANRIIPPVSNEQYKSGALLSKDKTTYANDATTSNLLLPKNIYAAKFPNILPNIQYIGQLEKKVTYDQYDNKGNILQYTLENGTPVAIIWGYNQTLPVAKIENATYTQANTAYTANPEDMAFRNSLPNSMITTYTYIPLVGVSTITDPKGDKITYNYDSFGRLKNVKDKNGNILSENEYHYKN